jgi:hypothetical protein
MYKNCTKLFSEEIKQPYWITSLPVLSLLACAVTPKNENLKDEQLVPSDQRPGRYYSGI